MNSLYDLLGISKTADSRTIKTAFKKKALHYHPDKNIKENSKEHFQNINNSYLFLKNNIDNIDNNNNNIDINDINDNNDNNDNNNQK